MCSRHKFHYPHCSVYLNSLLNCLSFSFTSRFRSVVIQKQYSNNRDIDELDVLLNLKHIFTLLLQMLTDESYTSVTDRQQTHVRTITSALHATTASQRLDSDAVAYQSGVNGGPDKLFIEPRCSYNVLFVRLLVVLGAMYCHSCYPTWLSKLQESLFHVALHITS